MALSTPRFHTCDLYGWERVTKASSLWYPVTASPRYYHGAGVTHLATAQASEPVSLSRSLGHAHHQTPLATQHLVPRAWETPQLPSSSS